jgi:MYXO-CTERM domain-containing protein
MKFEIKACVVAGLAVGSLVSATSAQIISQAPNQINGYFSDPTFPQSIADDFVIGAGGADLGVLTWYGGYFPSNIVVPDQFNIRIHGDFVGLPDGSASFLNLVNVAADTRTDTGVDEFGVDEYVYTLDLGGVHLDSGTYWIEIFNDTTQNSDNWFWETGDLDTTQGRLNNAFAVEAPGVTWIVNPGEMAFTIEAAVPTPGALAVLGLAGLATGRRRRA